MSISETINQADKNLNAPRLDRPDIGNFCDSQQASFNLIYCVQLQPVDGLQADISCTRDNESVDTCHQEYTIMLLSSMTSICDKSQETQVVAQAPDANILLSALPHHHLHIWVVEVCFLKAPRSSLMMGAHQKE